MTIRLNKLLAQRGLGARAFNGVPGPFRDLANQFDLAGCPHPRRIVIDAERGDDALVLEQGHADKGGNLTRAERCPVLFAEPLIPFHVVDGDGLAALQRLA